MSDYLGERSAKARSAAAEARAEARYLREAMRESIISLRQTAAELNAHRDHARRLMNEHTALMQGIRSRRG